MWRVAVIMMAVLILDIVLLILGEGSAFDTKCTEITRLVEAREHPTTKAVRAFETAREITQEAQRNGRLEFGSAILVVTAGGSFIAGRQCARQRKITTSTSSHDALPHT